MEKHESVILIVFSTNTFQKLRTNRKCIYLYCSSLLTNIIINKYPLFTQPWGLNWWQWKSFISIVIIPNTNQSWYYNCWKRMAKTHIKYQQVLDGCGHELQNAKYYYVWCSKWFKIHTCDRNRRKAPGVLISSFVSFWSLLISNVILIWWFNLKSQRFLLVWFTRYFTICTQSSPQLNNPLEEQTNFLIGLWRELFFPKIFHVDRK